MGTLRRLALGLFLIAATSALLLFSDLGSRKTSAVPAAQKTKRIALLQHASQAVLDQGREGMLAGLAEQGWARGKNLEVKLYNAEGDVTVSQAIGREMANGGNDLLMTISTPSLQAVANANKNGGTPHVFGLVADPVAAGVGIAGPKDHPAWLAGYGTMQPIAQAFAVAREMNPALRSVGVVYNAGEANAVAQIKLARKVCADMGISLVETTVDNSAGVGEAAAAMTARGVEAILVCGDVTVMTAVDAVIAAAKKAQIPVFSVIPPNVKHGALFDIGADYFEVGRLTGELAGDVLNGRDPATVSIDNVMPEVLDLNFQALGDLKDKWTISDALLKRAALVIDQNGAQKTTAVTRTPKRLPINPTGKKWKIAVVLYNESPPAEETLAGMKDGWRKSRLVEGKDYTLKVYSAQGDMSALGGIFDAAVTDGADLIVPMSTPSLQTAIHKIRTLPVVFTMIANPMAAGAGKSYEDHLPNITGVAVLSPFGDMLDLLEKYYPSYKRIGTLFCPAEANSVDLKDSLDALCKKRGFMLDAIAANSAAEFADSAMSLASRPIDAIVQISDNLSSAGFTAITKAARQTRKPLFSLNSTTVPLGAPIALGRDYHDAGIVTVEMIEKVIAGEDPARIPFVLPPKVKFTVSLPNAEALDMTIPDGLLKQATKVIK